MQIPNEKRRFAVIISILVIGAAIMSIVLRHQSRNAEVNLDPVVAAAEVMADETSALLGGKGQIVVVTFDTRKALTPRTAAQLKAFQERLKDRTGIAITAVETLDVNPSPGMPSWSGAQYTQLLERHVGVDAIVSFVGTPLFTEEEMRRLPQQLPRSVVFGGGGMAMPLRKLFERGLVHVAVVNRFTPLSAPTGASDTNRAEFERNFQIVRSNNAKALHY